MKLTTICSLTTIAALAAPVAAQGVMPYLPKNTIMAISAPDISVSMAEFQQMPLAKMWAEDEVQTFFGDVLEMAREQIDEGLEQARAMHEQGQLPVNPDDLMKLRVNGGTFAITHLELSEGEWGPMPKFGFVLHLDFGDSAPTWNTLIQMGLGILQEQAGNDMTMAETVVGDVKLMTLSPQRAPEGNEMSLNIAMVPNGILIGTLKDEVSGVLTAMASDTPALTASAGFAAATKTLDTGGAEAQMFMSPDPVMEFAMNALRMAQKEERDLQVVDMDGVERAMRAMGLRDLGTMAMTSSYIDGKSVTRMFHAHPTAGEGTAAAPAT